jgi:hypothetical protein
MGYDSSNDTQHHIRRVQTVLDTFARRLHDRGVAHDRSKLENPEKAAFDRLRPRLKRVTYGSPEYMASLGQLSDALAHHYAHNAHHPEHFADGIRGMSLLDIVEMLMDWKAASERHADGDIDMSIAKNQVRFGYSDELRAILRNTACELGWTQDSGRRGAP